MRLPAAFLRSLATTFIVVACLLVYLTQMSPPHSAPSDDKCFSDPTVKAHFAYPLARVTVPDDDRRGPTKSTSEDDATKRVRLVDALTGAPVYGAQLILLTSDFASRIGGGISDSCGVLSLRDWHDTSSVTPSAILTLHKDFGGHNVAMSELSLCRHSDGIDRLAVRVYALVELKFHTQEHGLGNPEISVEPIVDDQAIATFPEVATLLSSIRLANRALLSESDSYDMISRRLTAIQISQTIRRSMNAEGIPCLLVPFDCDVLLTAHGNGYASATSRVRCFRGTVTSTIFELCRRPIVCGTVMTSAQVPIPGAQVRVVVSASFQSSQFPAQYLFDSSAIDWSLTGSDGERATVELTFDTCTDENGAYNVSVPFTGRVVAKAIALDGRSYSSLRTVSSTSESIYELDCVCGETMTSTVSFHVRDDVGPLPCASLRIWKQMADGELEVGNCVRVESDREGLVTCEGLIVVDSYEVVDINNGKSAHLRCGVDRMITLSDSKEH